MCTTVRLKANNTEGVKIEAVSKASMSVLGTLGPLI